MKKSILILLLFTLIVPFISVLAEGTEIPGSITTGGTNNESGLTGNGFLLRDLNIDGYPEVVTSNLANAQINPQTNYRMELNISDIDGLSDIRNISFKFFNKNHSDTRKSFDSYTSTGVIPLDPNYDNNPFMIADDAFYVEWSEDAGFQLIGNPANSTWELITTQFTEVDSTTFKFEIDFKISKVAINNDGWMIGALIKDGANSDLDEESFVTRGNYAMMFYGETIIPENTQVIWEDINANSNFDASSNHQAYLVDGSNPNQRVAVTYISNGYYSQRVKSSSEWTATIPELPTLNHNKAFLTTKSAVSEFSEQEFGIDIGFDYDANDYNSATTHMRLGTDFVTFRGHELDTTTLNKTIWRSRTEEVGQDIDQMIFRVAIAERFQRATYEGTITVGIANELDIISYETYQNRNTENPNYIYQNPTVVGIYARTDAEVLALINDNDVQVPIYLKDGFVDLNDANLTINITDPALRTIKPIIGDVFVTGDNASITGLAILYGDLYVYGDNAVVNDVFIDTHSPGGNLHIGSSSFTGTAVTIDGSVFVYENANARLIGGASGESREVGINVYVTGAATFVLENYDVGEGKASISTIGNIQAGGNSTLTLEGNVEFNDLTVIDSTGYFLGNASSHPHGNDMFLSEGAIMDWQYGHMDNSNLTGASVFTKNDGENDNINLDSNSVLNFEDGLVLDDVTSNSDSSVFMNDGTISDRLILSESTVIVTAGTIGTGDDLASNGILMDTGSAQPVASTLTIAGGTIRNVKAGNDAEITMSGGTIPHITDLSDDVTFTLNSGTIEFLRAFDNIDLNMSGGSLYKAHLFDQVDFDISGGTLGNGNINASLISINDTVDMTMTGGTLNLGSMYNDKTDINTPDRSSNDTTNFVSDILFSNKRGLSIRDDASVTLESAVVINASTELELRDNATIDINTTDPFNRAVLDYSATFNEVGAEDSSIKDDTNTLVEIYVQPDGTDTLRAKRPGSALGTQITYDYLLIEGSGSAFEEARRLIDAHGYHVNVYLTEGIYSDDSGYSEILFDRDNLDLLYTSNERTSLRSIWGTTYLTSSGASNTAVLYTPVRVTATSNRIHGIYFDLTDSNILFENTAMHTDFINNYVHQSGDTESIIESSAQSFEIEGNYLTRPDDANTSIGVTIEGPLSSNSEFMSNIVNNISNHAVYITGLTDNDAITVNSNTIGLSGRPILNHGIYFNQNDLNELNVNSNTISHILDTAMVFENTIISGQSTLNSNTINTITNGHGIHFTSSFGFDENYIDMDFLNNKISASDSYHSVFFDNISTIETLTFFNERYEDSESGLHILGATTIDGITIDGGTFQRMDGNAIFLEGDQISNIQISHDDTLTKGHFTGSNSIFNQSQGTIQDIQQSAILISGSSLDGFEMNGFIIDDFALEGSNYAGLDLRVDDLSNLMINQSLIRVNTYQWNGSYYEWVFNRYDAMNMTFSNGSGPAIKFYLDDANTYSNNAIYNLEINNNYAGVEFEGTLSSSDPVLKIFNVTSQFIVTPDLFDLKTLANDQTGYVAGASTVTNEANGGITNNTFDLIDNTNTLDLRNFITENQSLKYTNAEDELYIVVSDGANTIRRMRESDQSDLFIDSAMDRVSLTTNTGINSATIDLEYYVDDDGLSIRGVAFDELTASSGELTVDFLAPMDAVKATVFIETEGSTFETQIDEALNDGVNIDLIVANASGSEYQPIDDSTVYRIAIEFENSDGDIIQRDGFILDFDVVTSSFITLLNSISSTQELENVLETSLISNIPANVSKTALLETVIDNLDTNAFNTYASFETLVSELYVYEESLSNALTYLNDTVQESTALDQELMINDIIQALTGTSIVKVDDGVGGLEDSDDLVVRLETLLFDLNNNIEQEIWVRQDLIDGRVYETFSDLESTLTTTLSELQSLTVYDPSLLVVSPSAFIVVTGTALGEIQTYLNSLEL